MKHTPGTWIAKGNFVFSEEADFPGTLTQTFARYVGADQAFANARLIAASPELFEAWTGHEEPMLWHVSTIEMLCRQYLKEHSWDSDEYPLATRDAIEEIRAACAQARVAIAKATGEEKS